MAAAPMMRRRRSLGRPFMEGQSFAALVELLEEPLGLIEVLARVHVLRIDLEYGFPLGNGLGQLFLSIVADAAIVILLDEPRPGLAEERGRVFVVGRDLRQLVERRVRVLVLLLVELALALRIE